MCLCVILYYFFELMAGQVHPYKNLVCKQRHLLGFPCKGRLWKSNTCCGLHKEPSNAPVQRDYTSPRRVCVCVCVRDESGVRWV